MATFKTESNAGVSIDTSGLKDLVTVLRRTQPELKKQFFKGLRVGANVVKEEAVFLSLWSSKIPGSIKVQGSGLHLRIVAKGSIAPNAAPMENHGQTGTFRHPLWGSWEWDGVTHSPGKTGDPRIQKARPFLAPALAARFDKVAEIVQSAVDRALLDAGFTR